MTEQIPKTTHTILIADPDTLRIFLWCKSYMRFPDCASFERALLKSKGKTGSCEDCAREKAKEPGLGVYLALSGLWPPTEEQ